MTNVLSCQCSCGKVRYTARAAPLLRFVCHCTICQAFNQAAHGDYAVFRLGDVELPTTESVHYGAYRPPPAIQRGKCAACGAPALEVMRLPALPQLVFVPATAMRDRAALPAPALHTFYHRRRADHDDGLPKFNGYWPSQIAFMWKLLGALRRARG